MQMPVNLNKYSYFSAVQQKAYIHKHYCGKYLNATSRKTILTASRLLIDQTDENFSFIAFSIIHQTYELESSWIFAHELKHQIKPFKNSIRKANRPITGVHLKQNSDPWL